MFSFSPEEYAQWQQNVANWDTIVQYDVREIIRFYKDKENTTQFGIFGFCWGGKISTLAASQMPEIKVAGLVHPSSVTLDMMDDVHAPMYLFPCLDDPDMVEFTTQFAQIDYTNCFSLQIASIL